MMRLTSNHSGISYNILRMRNSFKHFWQESRVLPIQTYLSRRSFLNWNSLFQQPKKLRIRQTLHAVSAPSPTPALSKPDDLVNALLSKVVKTDRGVLFTREEHGKVAEMVRELESFCVDEPVKCPLIFGEWDVLYCSNPTSPGGIYRSALGRLFFKTKDMIQALEAPDVVRNKVSFSLFGFLDGEVSLKGKLNILDEKWIQVVFESPEIKIGRLETQYGGESEVKLEILYIDEKLRLGKGSRGSLFVFQRRGTF